MKYALKISWNSKPINTKWPDLLGNDGFTSQLFNKCDNMDSSLCSHCVFFLCFLISSESVSNCVIPSKSLVCKSNRRESEWKKSEDECAPHLFQTKNYHKNSTNFVGIFMVVGVAVFSWQSMVNVNKIASFDVRLFVIDSNSDASFVASQLITIISYW